jgi:hypothetical protein
MSQKTITFSNFTGLDLTATLTIDDGDPKNFTVPCGGYRDPVSISVPTPSYTSASLAVQSSNYDADNSASAYMIPPTSTDLQTTVNDPTATTLVVIGINNPKDASLGLSNLYQFKNVSAGDLVYFNCLPSGKLVTGRRAMRASVSSIDTSSENTYAIGLTATGLSVDDVQSRGSALSDIGNTVYSILNGDMKLCEVPFADKIASCNSSWGSISLIFIIIFIIIIVVVIALGIWLWRKKKKSDNE